MSLSPLKFSFGVSVLAHGLVIGGAVWLGQFHRTPAVVAGGTATTLELLATPARAPEKLVEAVGAATLPAPTPPVPVLSQPEEVASATPIPSAPPAEAILPAPTPPVVAVTETVSGATPVVPVTAVATSAATTGDNRSPLPGKYSTTVAGSSITLAKPNAWETLEPEYPLAARRRSQEGTVIIRVTVSVQGEAAEVVIVQSSGYELLDQAALKFASTWKFTPASVGSAPVESKIERPVRFKLNR